MIDKAVNHGAHLKQQVKQLGDAVDNQISSLAAFSRINRIYQCFLLCSY